MHITRRAVLKASFAAALCGMAPTLARASIAPARTLSLYNTHTGESLKTVYWERGAYVPGALAEINHVLRDHRTGDVHAIDPNLLDLIQNIHRHMESSEPFQIISGYRSPHSNEMLHEHSSGVAFKSQHVLGKAIDLRLSDRNTSHIRDVAMAMQRGGVGYYASSDFVHVDTGRVRHW